MAAIELALAMQAHVDHTTAFVEITSCQHLAVARIAKDNQKGRLRRMVQRGVFSSS